MASDQDTTPFMFALTGNFENEFAIDIETGVLSLQQPLDYESIREYPDLLLIVFDMDFLNGNASLRVVVLDENDNTPTFLNDTVELLISESIPLESEIFEAVARDLDDTSNGQLTYSLDFTDTFLINALSGAVTVNSALDFETQEMYILTITASDSGNPARNSTLILNITIMDENDNAPIITNPTPVYSVVENVATGTLVGTVNAMDADSGLNSLVRFEIIEGNTADRFFIVPETGDIFTNATIDREMVDIYFLTVEVHLFF